MSNFKVRHKLEQGGGLIVPIGTIFPYMGNSEPANYMFCNGQAFDKNTYPELYQILGTNTLPNLSGKFLLGSSTNHAKGSTGGSEDAIIVSHTHNIQVYKSNEVGYIPANAWPASVTVRTDVNGIDNTGGTWTDRPSGVYSASRTMSDTGSSGTGKNMPPFYTINYIIRVK